MKGILLFLLFFIALDLRAQNHKDSELLKRVIIDCFSNKLINKNIDSVGSIVIINTTLWNASDKGKSYDDFISNKFSRLDSSTYTDFVKKNTKQKLVDSIQVEKQRIIYTSDSIKTNIFKQGGWTDFYKRFPNSIGFVEFSSVGFNKDKTQALIYYRQMIGFSNGNGFYVLYDLENGNWIKKQTKLGWTTK